MITFKRDKKKGFTLIELLIVIAIISIIVLIAVSSFPNSISSAKESKVKSDIKEQERLLIENEDYLESLDILSNEELQSLTKDKKLFSKEGYIEELSGEYKLISEEPFYISDLKGNVITDFKDDRVKKDINEDISFENNFHCEDGDFRDLSHLRVENKFLGKFRLNVKRDHYVFAKDIDIWHNPESDYFKIGYSYPPYGSELPSIDFVTRIKKDRPSGTFGIWDYHFWIDETNSFYQGGPVDISMYRIYDHYPTIENNSKISGVYSERRNASKLTFNPVITDYDYFNEDIARVKLSYSVKELPELGIQEIGCFSVTQKTHINKDLYFKDTFNPGKYTFTIHAEDEKGLKRNKIIPVEISEGDF